MIYNRDNNLYMIHVIIYCIFYYSSVDDKLCPAVDHDQGVSHDGISHHHVYNHRFPTVEQHEILNQNLPASSE